MGLRYVIIPLAILLYLWWSYRSIREIRREFSIFMSFSTDMWLLVNLIAILYFFVIGGVGLIIKYW